MMHRALQADRARIIGSPLERDATYSRLRDRQRRLSGRSQDDSLQSLIDVANAKLAGLIARVERAPRAKVSPELRAEIERFERGPEGHRCPQCYGYKYVELGDVAEATRDAVADGVRRATNKLAGFPANSGPITPPLAEPSVRFFRNARNGEREDFRDHQVLHGLHRLGSNIVNIRADLPPRQARRTAAHETYHWGSDDRSNRDEIAAENFAAAFSG